MRKFFTVFERRIFQTKLPALINLFRNSERRKYSWWIDEGECVWRRGSTRGNAVSCGRCENSDIHSEYKTHWHFDVKVWQRKLPEKQGHFRYCFLSKQSRFHVQWAGYCGGERRWRLRPGHVVRGGVKALELMWGVEERPSTWPQLEKMEMENN